MTIFRHFAGFALFAGALATGSAAFAGALATGSAAFAAAPPPALDAAPAAMDQAPDGAPPHGFGPPGPGAPGPGMPFAHLHGLQLSEAQQDKLFAIMHEQAPQRREQDKAIRKAHQALRELGRAERFDDARAVALSRELGQAIAAEALLRARTDAKVRAVLTPEQRDRLRQRRERGPGRGDGDGAGGGASAAQGQD